MLASPMMKAILQLAATSYTSRLRVTQVGVIGFQMAGFGSHAMLTVSRCFDPWGMIVLERGGPKPTSSPS